MLLEITLSEPQCLEVLAMTSTYLLFGASSLTSPLHFGLYIFLWCSYTELILKSKGKRGTVHHFVGSSSPKETSKRKAFVIKHKVGVWLLGCWMRFWINGRNWRQWNDVEFPWRHFQSKSKWELSFPMVVVYQCALVWKLDHATKNSQ